VKPAGAPPSKVVYVSRVNGQSFDSQEALQAHYSECRHIPEGSIVLSPEFQSYIPAPPARKEDLRATYSRNDEITVKSWWPEWQGNKRTNWQSYDVPGNSVLTQHAKWAYKPVIIAGAGPSLKRNAHHLLKRGGMGLVSCLHNFGFFHDLGVKPDYYLNLDAGDITIPEMAQGGKRDEEYYWEASKDYTLVTALHCNPKLHKKWKGKILWFDTFLHGMDETLEAECPGITDFRMYFQTGGNTLGACHYMAKAVLGASPLVFVGADFSFSYEKKFHPFDTPYDKQFAGVVSCHDVFGNKVATWPSYFGFKAWFEHQAMGGQGNTPGTYINCTEGGILGAYADGNIMQIAQRKLKDVITEYTLHEMLPSLIADKARITLLY
jgi:hypothetical protein